RRRLLHVVGGGDQGRDEPDDLAPGAAGQQQQPAPGGLLLRRGGGRTVGVTVGVAELVAEHQAEPSYVGDLLGLAGDVGQRGPQLGATVGGVLHQVLFLDHVHRRQRGGARDGVGAV